jgi:hypothetical protein
LMREEKLIYAVSGIGTIIVAIVALSRLFT